jgi:hypothetical protein
MFKLYYKYYLFLYLSLFACVNIEFFHLSHLYYKSDYLADNFKFLRSLIPFVLIAQSLFFLIFVFVKKKKFFHNYYLYLILFYLILQTFALFFSNHNPTFNIFYIFLSLAAILVFFQINQLNKNQLNFFIYLSMFILFILFILFFTQNIILFFKTPLTFYSEFPVAFRSEINPKLIDPSLNLQEQLPENFTIYQTILGEIPPRSSGISRIALILSTFFFIIIEKKSNFKLIFFIFLIYLNFAIFISQSRLNIVSILLIYFLIIFFSKKKIFAKIISLIMLLLLPFLFASYLNYSKIEKIFPFKTNSKLILDSPITENSENQNSSRKLHMYTLTGREKIWVDIYNFTKSRWYIGNGPQADRYTVGQSASNLFFYAYSSGGVFSFLIFIIFYLKIFFTLKKIISIKGIKYIINDRQFFFTIIILLYFIFRSLFESSFGVFGIDLIIFLTFLIFFNKKTISLKNLTYID